MRLLMATRARLRAIGRQSLVVEQASTELDLQKRAGIMKKAEAILMKDMPWIPIMYYGKSQLISPKIHGFVQNTRGVYPSRFLSKDQ